MTGEYYLIPARPGITDCIINLDSIQVLRKTKSTLLIYLSSGESMPIGGKDAEVIWSYFLANSKNSGTLTSQSTQGIEESKPQ